MVVVPLGLNITEFCLGIWYLFHLAQELRFIETGVAFGEIINFDTTIFIEAVHQVLSGHGCSCLGEVEIHHLETVLQFCGVTAYPEIAEEGVKFVFCIDVIIGVHHTQEYALAKAARAYQKQIFSSIFQLREIHGLIHKIEILCDDLRETCHSIRYAFYFRSEERRVGKECRSRWSP